MQTSATPGGVFSVLLAPFASMGESNDNRYTWRTPRWGNLELGGESRRNRFAIRGLALLLNPEEYAFQRAPHGSPSLAPKGLDPVRGLRLRLRALSHAS